jgi:hypothetical protein
LQYLTPAGSDEERFYQEPQHHGFSGRKVFHRNSGIDVPVIKT